MHGDFFGIQLIERIVNICYDLAEFGGPAEGFPLPDVVNALLGVIQQVIRIAVGVFRFFNDFVGNRNQRPDVKFIPQDPAVFFKICGGRNNLSKLIEVFYGPILISILIGIWILNRFYRKKIRYSLY